jgi:DNA-binding winged helix-turn-helix (wHTH) protein/Tfp pilus assembly protein PilF
VNQEVRIDLAHVDAFRLGALTVEPSVRTVSRESGPSEVLEPRVMQVLVALAEAKGRIVSRADLTERCWDGRVVGEDAINRVLSRLRRVADGIGRGCFRIETITKVGYRLLPDGELGEGLPEATGEPGANRRGLLLAIAAVGALVAGGGAWLTSRDSNAIETNADASARLQLGLNALTQLTREGRTEATGQLRQLVLIHPDFADGWGALAMAYALSSRWDRPNEAADRIERATNAAQRALASDPDNAYAQVARATALPRRGNWQRAETLLRQALRAHPDNREVLTGLASVLMQVGRYGEATELLGRARRITPVSADLFYRSTMSLWSAQRSEEADEVLAQGRQVYPTHFALWFADVYRRMFSGRAVSAMAIIDDDANRPSVIRAEEFAAVRAVAEAISRGTPSLADEAMRAQLDRAHEGAGLAENAIQFACALGRIDDAYQVADAYFFNRGFDVPAVRFSAEQGNYTARNQRLTEFLFFPSTRAMREDPRFEPLLAELGLELYWNATGSRPDYRRL